MLVSFAAKNVCTGVMSEPPSFIEPEVFGAPSAFPSSKDLPEVAPAMQAIDVVSERSQAPLPADILDLLMSTAQFVEAVLQLDRSGSTFSAESACYDTLANVKRSLRQVALSRTLE